MTMYHLTHNNGYTPWCQDFDYANASKGPGDVLVYPDQWCPHCKSIYNDIHNTKDKDPGPVIKLYKCSIEKECDGKGTHKITNERFPGTYSKYWERSFT